jgi:hypothetical protein|tara:strand:- start:236 stop:1468 length:1233 start_codon:yes stop_codon:yes gene_type:complete
MGSTFTTFSGQKVKGFAGKEYSVPVYLQFVPGYCVEVVHSVESVGYKGNQTINSIYAVSHIQNTTGKRRQQSYSEDNRYFPLLRNHGDVPTKGDPVLLCTIGKINYYLGPLNTINNSPTWNDDFNYKKELTMSNSDNSTNTPRGLRGESLNFNKEVLYSRLQKIRKENLDYGTSFNEVTGDYLIEGRHGNSVRVGSRSNNPYIFISNERGVFNKFETLSDGSLISITSNGTLAEHFPSYVDIIDKEEKFGFTLSSDGVEDNTYPIGDIQSDLNNKADIQETIYGYTGNQMLLNSDRIIINSKLDDIFVSSIKDIHIGSGRHLSISAPKSLNILSDNVNIGNKERASEMQPMVLGDMLKEVLNDIVNLVPSIVITTQLGPQSPMPQINADIQKITNKIESITSTKHNIEGN